MEHSKKFNIFLLLFDAFTILIWVWIVADYFTKTQVSLPLFLSTLYLLILTYYVGDKEIRRWRRKYSSRFRKGEYFVFLWIITMIIMAGFYVWGGAKSGYRIPQELPTIAGSVLVLYFLTEFLKKKQGR